MNELNIFAEQCLENGGQWYKLEESAKGCLVKSQRWFEVNGHLYGDTPVFQVFDNAGKRKFASTSYSAALTYYVEEILYNKEEADK